MNKSFFVALLHIVNAYFINSLQYGYEMCVDLIYFKSIIFALCENNNAKRGNMILISLLALPVVYVVIYILFQETFQEFAIQIESFCNYFWWDSLFV